MTIRIFITGGTIDNLDINKPKTDESGSKETYMPEMLKQARISLPVETEKLMLKDSRELTNKDRELILKKCQGCKEDKIIITHGTFNMPETARLLGEKIENKTVVLTGSAIPFNEKNSDALFNLGCAISAVQTLPKGVYVTMNGKIFSWDNVTKNLKTGEFEVLKIR